MDKEYDIIIIGSGFAGLFAAIEAAKQNASVIVLEKMESFGGNSIMCAGQIAVPESDEQKFVGIIDEASILAKDMLHVGRGLNNIRLVNTFVSNIADIYNDLKKLGIKFKKEVYPFSGHSVPRILLTENETGRDIYEPLFNEAVESGVVFKNRALVEHILYDNVSEILGIRVRENYDFNNKFSGTLCNYKYKKALIIASGGWAADSSFIAVQNPMYKDLESTASYGATAECLRFLMKLDAIPVLLDSYQLGPWASPDERGAGYAANFADYALLGGIMINTATGRRFVNETADRKTISDEELKLIHENGSPRYPILMCSSTAAELSYAKDNALKSGALRKFHSAGEAAEYYGIDKASLTDEITKWNSFVANSKDTDFSKDMKYSHKIENEIFAMRLWPKIHYCNGGVAINEDGRLISMRNLKEFPNIYACGEITGGLHGECRLAAVSAADAMVFGKIAGRNALR